ncbi:MAG: virulence factor [Ardenticatenaceae bacterium]|nr:virulence factor [Ardenticatenaceae bacterium]MCB9446560.1 virulence factor [Ardenticatenaceae bacterium]
MALKYQIIYWRDIPTQIRVKKDGDKQVSRQLSRRFMAAMSAASTRSGTTDAEDYMDAWRMTNWQDVEPEVDNPEDWADRLIEQLEADYPGDRLRQMVKQDGWSELTL